MTLEEKLRVVEGSRIIDEICIVENVRVVVEKRNIRVISCQE